MAVEREIPILQALGRTAVGTHVARAIRGQGRVPAVIHGRRPDDKHLITLDHKDIARIRRLPWFWNTVYDIDVEGKGTFRVIPRCHSRHFMYYHNTINVTFMKFEPFRKYLIQVPVILENQEVCIGIKRGGLLSRDQSYFKCWWAGDENIPQQITIDLRNMDIGDVAHNQNVAIPSELLPHLPHHKYVFASITGGQSLESQSAMNNA